jgi:murein DD-endopeptidase MepM/ murein hydrolase activator NlpD
MFTARQMVNSSAQGQTGSTGPITEGCRGECLLKGVQTRTRYRLAAAGVMGCVLIGGVVGAPRINHASAENAMANGSLALASNMVVVPETASPEDVTLSRRLWHQMNKSTVAASYIVTDGDSLWSISNAYAMDVDSLVALNPDVTQLIQPGQQLRVAFGATSPVKPVDAEQKRPETRTVVASRSGVRQAPTPAAEVPPVAVAAVAPKPSAPVVSGFIWPLTNGLLFTEFGWQPEGYYHRGLDIAQREGSVVVAAKAGTVIFAGWKGGYGYCIDIDHGDGLVTRYGHASVLLVKRGDVVGRGAPILRVGSTGNSTGPHLHFEVLVNGQERNPRNFLPQ